MATINPSVADFRARMHAQSVPAHPTMAAVLRPGQRWQRKHDSREITIRTVYTYDRKVLVQCCGQHRFLVTFGELRAMYSLVDLGGER